MKTSFPTIFLGVVLSTILCLTAPAMAEEVTGIDAVMEGFGQESDPAAEEILNGFDEEGPWTGSGEETAEKPEPSIFHVSGHAKIGASANFAHTAPSPGRTDWRGLSRLRPELQLEIKADLHDAWQAYASAKAAWDTVYGLRDRDTFTGQVLGRNESEVALREAWLQGRLSQSLDLKVGRQIVVWGKSDNIRVTDVLNPLDLREPGLTDIEDLRLPVTMTRLDYYFGKWSLTGLAVHEIRFNKLPAWGSDFFPAAAPLPPESLPSDSAGNTEFGLALSGVFSGWDIAFYYADIYDDLPHIKRLPGLFALERRHTRLDMFGGAANLAWSNWLFKAESAMLRGLEFFNAAGETFDRLDLLGGVEYSGFSDTTVTIEAVSRRIIDFQDRLKAAPDEASKEEFQTALRISRDFLSETLNLTVLALIYGPTGQNGALQRFTAQYELTDAVEITGGLVLYQSGDLPEMQHIGDNDRVYLEAKYSF